MHMLTYPLDKILYMFTLTCSLRVCNQPGSLVVGTFFRDTSRVWARALHAMHVMHLAHLPVQVPCTSLSLRTSRTHACTLRAPLDPANSYLTPARLHYAISHRSLDGRPAPMHTGTGANSSAVRHRLLPEGLHCDQHGPHPATQTRPEEPSPSPQAPPSHPSPPPPPPPPPAAHALPCCLALLSCMSSSTCRYTTGHREVRWH